ncbi:TetR/AcrR family transcriptional regulator [Paractinoplanes atraurantiacus]|uniref:DNA-binding transcriptional regulator, AcrR family n=1 Tax=Paractinoplanes atraurantiacus TaxID=1036182 RepID=A0A285F3X1_9ACTN|nr:TetR/AcrR family transcriptional regulator [Actinoplanes atraurantiacus]SNY06020.1 DNA-binding transcriptional regulator, AcrR family [Actinoplanes atraurantiacus]
MAKASYHHGDLRRALLRAAAEAITENGIASLSMRDLARRAGVSHTAPTHHFGDMTGLLTAFAVQGYEELGKALSTSWLASGSFVELGVTYVRFATTRSAHFEVMFRPDLYRADDPDLVKARARSADTLYAGVAGLPDGTLHQGERAQRASEGTAEAAPPEVRAAGRAAWSMAHGFATLWLTGAFPDRGEDPEAVARLMFRQLNERS